MVGRGDVRVLRAARVVCVCSGLSEVMKDSPSPSALQPLKSVRLVASPSALDSVQENSVHLRQAHKKLSNQGSGSRWGGMRMRHSAPASRWDITPSSLPLKSPFLCSLKINGGGGPGAEADMLGGSASSRSYLFQRPIRHPPLVQLPTPLGGDCWLCGRVGVPMTLKLGWRLCAFVLNSIGLPEIVKYEGHHPQCKNK